MLNNYMFYVLISCSLILFVSSRTISHHYFSNTNEIDILTDHGKFILANMDQSINPCEDFYQYSCGNFNKNKMISVDGRNGSITLEMQLQINNLIKEFLNNSTSEQNRTSEIKIKKFYASCIAAKNNTFEKGFKELLTTIKKPNLKDSNKTLDWIYINFYSNLGIYPLLPFNISYNLETLTFEIFIGPPNPVLSNFNFENFTKNIEVKKGQIYDTLKEEFHKVKQFEQILTFSNEPRLMTEVLPLNKFITVHKRDNFDWKFFFNIAFNGSIDDTWIVNNELKSIDRLQILLSNTDNDILILYVKWRTIIRFYNLWKAFNTEESIEDACMEATLIFFTNVINPWFINATFDGERRADILKLSKSIRNSLSSLIDQCEWMDDQTKSGAKTKLNSMDISVGFTDEMMQYKYSDMLYENISISENNFWQNLINLRNNTILSNKSKIGTSENPNILKNTWSVNAGYLNNFNELYLNSGISQLPLYHQKFPASLKYGGIGFIIGHEISHAFDFDSHKLDYIAEDGNWWSNNSLMHLEERYKCLEAQYYKFIFNGKRNDGNYTLNENMADNIGAKLAYHAYINQLEYKSQSDLKPLFNVEFKNKQLFFVKFAQSWCTGYDAEMITNKMEDDEHSYEKFRVQGTLMNMPEFSEAFQCQLGTAMNPFKKCIIW